MDMGHLATSSDLQTKHIAAGYTVSRAWRLFLKDLGLHPAAVLQRAQLPGDLFSRDSATLNSLQYFSLLTALEDEANQSETSEFMSLPSSSA